MSEPQKYTKVSWGTATTRGGSIELWDDGIIVFTECHGCVSTELTDRRTIVALHEALGEWLAEHPEPS